MLETVALKREITIADMERLKGRGFMVFARAGGAYLRRGKFDRDALKLLGAGGTVKKETA